MTPGSGERRRNDADNHPDDRRRGTKQRGTSEMRTHSGTANAAQDAQKDRSDYIAELADHLDIDTNALQAALADATFSVVKALVTELGPGGGEP